MMNYQEMHRYILEGHIPIANRYIIKSSTQEEVFAIVKNF